MWFFGGFPNEIFYKVGFEVAPTIYFKTLVDMAVAKDEYARGEFYQNVVVDHFLQMPFLFDMLVVGNGLHNSVKRIFKKSELPFKFI